MGDLLIGASALIAEMNGLFNVSHIRDKLVEMVHLNETLFACGIAAAVKGAATQAGGCEADRLLANVCKLNITRFPYEISRLATDIAGGLIGTMPPAKTLDDPVVGKYVRKYLKTCAQVEATDRMKVLRIIESLVAGAGAVAYLIESVHGAGPPQAQKVMIARQADFPGKIQNVKKTAGDQLNRCLCIKQMPWVAPGSLKSMLTDVWQQPGITRKYGNYHALRRSRRYEMPIYEFRCCNCCEEFETLVFNSNEKVTCPKCEGDKVERLMSGFAHKSEGGKMVSSSSGCSSCSGGSCASCH